MRFLLAAVIGLLIILTPSCSSVTIYPGKLCRVEVTTLLSHEVIPCSQQSKQSGR